MRPDPWKEVRALRPREILVRVIAVAQRLQFFLSIEPTDRNLARGASLHDGSTIVTPSVPGGRTHEDFQSIVYAADMAWSTAR